AGAPGARAGARRSARARRRRARDPRADRRAATPGGLMADYIRRGGEQAFAPPFVQTGTKLSGWLLPSDLGAQQKTIDRYLNAPMAGRSGFTYRAMMPAVLFAIAPIASTRSLTEPDAGFGYTPETDAAFWVLAGRGHDEGWRWVLAQLLWLRSEE